MELCATAAADCRAPAIDGAQFTSVAQVLRFDVTKEWVYQNWSRKSTGPTDVGLFAIRVPLVMGTQMTSLAGSLTYYFDAQRAGASTFRFTVRRATRRRWCRC